MKAGRREFLKLGVAASAALLPLPAFAQEERATEKAAIEKARQEAAAKQQASPEPGRTDEKNHESSRNPSSEVITACWHFRSGMSFKVARNERGASLPGHAGDARSERK